MLRPLHFRRLVRTLAIPILVALAACGGSDEGDSPGMASGASSETPANGEAPAREPGAAPGDYSIFHLESTWWDQTGNRQPLARLEGKVRLLSMVYTSCTFSCPQILADMKRVEGALTPEELERFGLVLVSVDPERDTPERLARFAEEIRVDSERWTLVSSEPDRILELAAIFGVRYRKETPEDFSHSNVIVVLDPRGEVVYRQEGFGSGPGELTEAVKAAIAAG